MDESCPQRTVEALPASYPLQRTSLPKDLPLLYNHDAKEPAGSIDALYYDAKGQLMVRATVTHPRARRCQAFSIANGAILIRSLSTTSVVEAKPSRTSG